MKRTQKKHCGGGYCNSTNCTKKEGHKYNVLTKQCDYCDCFFLVGTGTMAP